MTAIPFEYSNLSNRPPGRLLAIAARLSAGVREVQAQISPFAESWQAANRAALESGPRQSGDLESGDLESGDLKSGDLDSGRDRSGPGPSDRPLWVVLGDSMSQGIGAPAFDRGWVGQLAADLARQGRPHRVLNLSFSGARVRDVLDRQLPALRALAIHPDLVTVMIGSNDMVSPAHRRQLPAAFAELLRAVPAGSVIAALPNPNAVSREVNALLAAAAAERRISVADLGQVSPRSWRGKLAADHFHPNELGYADLARSFADVLHLAQTPTKST